MPEIAIENPMVLAADKPEFVPNKYNKTSLTDSICGNCPMLEACRERVKNGLWLYCEIPAKEEITIFLARSEYEKNTIE